MAGTRMSAASSGLAAICMLLQICYPVLAEPDHDHRGPGSMWNFTTMDKQLLGVALNLEYFEAEYFLYGAYGSGLDTFAPNLTGGGPTPIGGRRANVDNFTTDTFQQMGLQEVGHIRAIKRYIEEEAFARPQLDISVATWAKVFDSALNTTLSPPFDPYANSVNYFLSSYAIPYVGLTGYTGSNPYLKGFGAKSLAGRLLGVESAQDAIIRTWLYERKNTVVEPYWFTIAEATDAISALRNSLDHGALDDEGLTYVPEDQQSACGKLLACDADALSFTRTPKQIFSVVYSTGNASIPGGFYPRGGNGTIAKGFLGQPYRGP